MKNFIIRLLALFMVFIALATSCNPEEKYPKDVSFTEYSLSETQCQWANLPYDNKVIIINSAEELEKYLTGKESDYPAIDFTKQTLLLASGKTEKKMKAISINNLQQISKDSASLSIVVVLSNTDEDYLWCVAIVINEIKSLRNVALDIKQIILPIEYPIDIPYEVYSLGGTACMWAHYNYHKVLEPELAIINSYEELENYIECIDGGSFPAIDFSRYTLLLAYGRDASRSCVQLKSLQQLSEQRYKMEVNMYFHFVGAVNPWEVPIIVRKLGNGDIIEFNYIRLNNHCP